MRHSRITKIAVMCHQILDEIGDEHGDVLDGLSSCLRDYLVGLDKMAHLAFSEELFEAQSEPDSHHFYHGQTVDELGATN